MIVRRAAYVVMLAAATGGSAYYYKHTLAAREAEYSESERTVESKQAALEELREELGRVRARVSGLDNDSLEVEAAIRRNKRLVREGEVVYRIEAENADPGIMPLEPSEPEFEPEEAYGQP